MKSEFVSIMFVLLPFVCGAILFYLADRARHATKKSKPVENEEIFDHLFLKNSAE
jgi:hypothetical protein